MRFHRLRDAVLNKTGTGGTLPAACLWYLLSLMVETRKHSLKFASGLSGVGKPAFSKFLKNNKDVTKYTLDELSKKQAKKYSRVLKKTEKLPWRVCMIIDTTGHGRSSPKAENVQRLNPGHGTFVGHKWTNIILFFNEIIIPLPPISYYTKKYCRENKVRHRTEHECVIEYLNDLNLYDFTGYHDSGDVAVLTDSGFDNRKIQNTIRKRGWHFVTALKRSRSVKSEAKYAGTPECSGWYGIAEFFKKYRKPAWETVRIQADDPKKKRKDFRVRHTDVFLRYVGKVRAVCSEFKKKKSGGRRKYTVCSDLRATPRQILIVYGIRWKIEIFHKHVKMHLGFADTAAKHFSSVVSHVHLVYCAFILLQSDLPGVGKGTVAENQRKVAKILKNKENARVIHELSKIGGAVRYKNELKSALAA